MCQKSRSWAHICVVMIFFNLAYPEWLPIKCKYKLLNDTMCQVKTRMHNPGESYHIQKQVCEQLIFIQRQNVCMLFHWFKGDLLSGKVSKTFNKIQKANRVIWSGTRHFDLLHSIIDAVSTHFSSFLFFEKGNWHHFTFTKFLNLFYFQENVTYSSFHSGFVVLHSKLKAPKMNNVVSCKKGGYISEIVTCNQNKDCPFDHSDENNLCNCTDVTSVFWERRKCKYVAGHKCGPLYFMTLKGDCAKHFYPPKNQEVSTVLKCENSTTFAFALQSCFRQKLQPGTEETLSDCEESGQLHCASETTHCFNVFEICLFILNKCQQLSPCQDGTHLENCKQFECSTKFKCPGSYCLHWRSVCDGKWDCPDGGDELKPYMCGTFMHLCKQMFICVQTHFKCIHPGCVCDGNRDCPLGDDELLCEIRYQMCPSVCQCLAFAMYCSNVTITFPQEQIIHRFIHLEMINWTQLEKGHKQFFLQQIPETVILFIHKANLSTCCDFKFPSQLQILSLSFNSVPFLYSFCFHSHEGLGLIRLDNNLISALQHKSFSNLAELHFLDLSNNPLKHIEKEVICTRTHLKDITMILAKIRIESASSDSFGNIPFRAIITTDYSFCCLIPNVKCTAKLPWYLSCENILPQVALKVTYLSFAVMIFVVNVISIVWQTQLQESSKTSVLTIITINCNDFLCGVYLGGIAAADLSIGNNFLFQEKNWKSGVLCFSEVCIVLSFTIFSSMILVFLAKSRLEIVKTPVDTEFKKISFVTKWISGLAISSMFLAVSLTLILKFTSGSVPINLCLPFVDPTNSVAVVKVIIYLCSLLQFSASTSIVILHVQLIHKYLQSQKTLEGMKSGNHSSVPLVVQLILLSFSCIFCWIPTTSVYLSAMFLDKYPTEMVIWILVASMPVNSYLNPIIFSVYALRNFLTGKQ